MVLSKALKAKLSSIPSEVASLSKPALIRTGRKTNTIIGGLRLATHHGNSSRTHRALLEGPSRKVYIWCVVRMELQVFSLSVEEGRSTFGVMAGIWAKF